MSRLFSVALILTIASSVHACDLCRLKTCSGRAADTTCDTCDKPAKCEDGKQHGSCKCPEPECKEHTQTARCGVRVRQILLIVKCPADTGKLTIAGHKTAAKGRVRQFVLNVHELKTGNARTRLSIRASLGGKCYDKTRKIDRDEYEMVWTIDEDDVADAGDKDWDCR